MKRFKGFSFIKHIYTAHKFALTRQVNMRLMHNESYDYLQLTKPKNLNQNRKNDDRSLLLFYQLFFFLHHFKYHLIDELSSVFRSVTMVTEKIKNVGEREGKILFFLLSFRLGKICVSPKLPSLTFRHNWSTVSPFLMPLNPKYKSYVIDMNKWIIF